MKTNELLLFTATPLLACQLCISQTTLIEKQDSSVHPNALNSSVFRTFTGGINAIYSSNEAKGSIDLSVQTYHYFLVTGKHEVKDSLVTQQLIGSEKQQFKGFDFYLLNRAAIDFDTNSTITGDYMTSMQPAPLTLRFSKEYFLTGQDGLSAVSYKPVISIKLTTDGRAIPFEAADGNFRVGASSHFFVTFSTQFTRLEFDRNGKEIDRGVMYLQPSFGIALGNNELMRQLFTDRKNAVLLSSECRLGFRSQKKSVNDCSLLFRYAFNDILGPKLRAGIILSSFN